MNSYGKELILDLRNCNPARFHRYSIKQFFSSLCATIGMEPCDLHFWDDLDTPEEEKETEPHLKGTSAIQFIKTSNITIHTLDLLKAVFINVFSCKDFDEEYVTEFAKRWFKGEVKSSKVIMRG